MFTVAELFAFENAHPRHTSHKEALIFDELGMRPARFYQLLRHAALSADGRRMDPQLCRRVLDREAA